MRVYFLNNSDEKIALNFIGEKSFLVHPLSKTAVDFSNNPITFSVAPLYECSYDRHFIRSDQAQMSIETQYTFDNVCDGDCFTITYSPGSAMEIGDEYSYNLKMHRAMVHSTNAERCKVNYAVVDGQRFEHIFLKKIKRSRRIDRYIISPLTFVGSLLGLSLVVAIFNILLGLMLAIFITPIVYLLCVLVESMIRAVSGQSGKDKQVDEQIRSYFFPDWLKNYFHES